MANQFIDNFFKQLSPTEEKIISKYLNNNIKLEDSKTKEVFKNLTTGQNNLQVSKPAFNKIKSRLFEASLNSLLLEDYIAPQNYSHFDKTIIKLKRQMLQCQILYKSRNTSKSEVLKHQLKQIIKEAKTIEAYPVLIEALTMQKYFLSPKTNLSNFTKINQEIKHQQFCFDAVFRAADNYFLFVYYNLHTKSFNQKRFLPEIKIIIKETRQDFLASRSQQVNYYLHFFEMWLFEFKKNYKKALDACEKLNSLMLKHKHIRRPDRQGFIFKNLNQYYTHLSNYPQALKIIDKAEPYLIPKSTNEIRLNIERFKVSFYAGKLKLAQKYLDKFLNGQLVDFTAFERSKSKYYEICLRFQQKQFKEAFLLLSKPMEIEKDKERWNIAVRIITIMINIELKDFKTASRNLQALRKFLARNKSNDKISKRDILIIATLRELEKKDFIFREENLIINKMLKQLSAPNTKLSWEHFTPEMVKFHEWLAKRKRR